MQKYSLILLILAGCSIEVDYYSKREYCNNILSCKCNAHIEKDYYVCDCSNTKIKIPDICKEEE